MRKISIDVRDALNIPADEERDGRLRAGLIEGWSDAASRSMLVWQSYMLGVQFLPVALGLSVFGASNEVLSLMTNGDLSDSASLAAVFAGVASGAALFVQMLRQAPDSPNSNSMAYVWKAREMRAKAGYYDRCANRKVNKLAVRSDEELANITDMYKRATHLRKLAEEVDRGGQDYMTQHGLELFKDSAVELAY